MSVMKRLADARMFGRKRETEPFTGANTMQLCKHSKSEHYRSAILSDCPLGLTTTEAKKCHCKKRLYHQGPQDLRVLSCCFPRTWNGDEIRDVEAFAGSLKSKKPEAEPKTKRSEKTMSDETVTTHSTATSTSRQLTLASRIADPMAAIHTLGNMLKASCMLGCTNPAQGQLLAMHCLIDNVSPLTILREFHLIGGNLTMKSDVMLAKFRQAGGSHEIVERSAERAAIELVWKRKKYPFEFTWEEAKGERYIYGKDGKSLKDNWSTPRRRMQMMWARLVSDAVRAVSPECVAGYYTPEDLGATSESEVVADDSVIDVKFDVVPDVESADPTPAEKPKETTDESPFEPEAKAAEPPPTDSVVAEVTAKVTHDQLLEMKKLKDELGYGADTWKRVLDNRGVTTAHDLSHEDAETVLDWLHRRKDQVAGKNELDGFANRVMGGQEPQ